MPPGAFGSQTSLAVPLVGIRTRKLRAVLSAIGIAIGVAAIVAVLGLSASSESGLLAEIHSLGTNLLTVTNGQTLSGQTAELPTAAPAMIGRIGPVSDVQGHRDDQSGRLQKPTHPLDRHQRLAVDAASLGLPNAVGTSVAEGKFLNPATGSEPVCVLGAAAAQRLGIDRVYPGERIWLNHMWFYVAGILTPPLLTPEIDSEVIVGYAAAEKYLGFDGHPTEIYLRVEPTSETAAVDGVLAATANPEAPTRWTSPCPRPLWSRRPTRRSPKRSLLGPRCRGTAGRYGRRRKHHGHLRARTSKRDRPSPCGRHDQRHIRSQFLLEAIPLRS